MNPDHSFSLFEVIWFVIGIGFGCRIGYWLALRNHSCVGACYRTYDDETRWTICPHNSLSVSSDAPLCKEHDLYNCPLPHDGVFERPATAYSTGANPANATREDESLKIAPIHKRLWPYLLTGIILAIAFLLFLASSLRSEPLRLGSPFEEKYNSFVVQMNKLTSKLQSNIADRREFQRADKAWERLHNDEGWLK